MVHNLGGIPSLNLDGTALTPDVDVFASYDEENQTLWLTLDTDWSGSHTLATGEGMPSVVTVTTSTSSISLAPSATTTFSASVEHAEDTSVTWSVVEENGGEITQSGLYTAPANTGTYHVRATSNQDPSKSATITITVALKPPSVTSFAAAPSAVAEGESTTLSWNVEDANSLSISPDVGTVTGNSISITPSDTTTYTLTATGPGGTATATASVSVGEIPTEYTYIYQSGLQGNWDESGWGSTFELDAAPSGHTGSAAIEVSIPNAWEGFALADIAPPWTPTYHSLNTVTTLAFDVFIASDSTGHDDVLFILEDVDKVDTPSLTDLIDGWDSMNNEQRFDQWHSVSIDLASLNPEFSEFYQIVFFKMSATDTPHFKLADIRFGEVEDLLPPNISLGTPLVDYNTLSLPFTTDEACIYRIEYGYGDYTNTLTGSTVDYATSHTPTLNDLNRGQTLQYRIIAIDHSGNEGTLSGSVIITDPPAPTTATVTISIDPSNTRAISPWIYGMNFYNQSDSIIRNLPINRHGGNRWTAYNWENNASNAGADWYYHNDSYLGGGNTPGEAVRSHLAYNYSQGYASLITVQLQGYVSADKNGDDVMATVPDLETRLATRFKQVIYRKSDISNEPFTTTPDTTDDYVFMDEFIWAMDELIAEDIYSDPDQPTFVMLDNEPEIWSTTHEEIQPELIPYQDYIANTIDLSKAVKDVDPDIVLFGPVHFGFSGIYSWQGSDGLGGDYWFTDHYLTQMKAASEADGRRLLDVYNFNWYSEATAGGTRVTNFTGTDLTEDQIQAIVQSPRSLWDETYTETSWITQYVTGGPIALFPKLKDKIDTIWPGTKLAITEWNNGGQNHIAGAIAVADNLGIFGQYGLFEASFWPLGTITKDTFDGAGFAMYRNYDGKLGSFGDISLPTTSSDTSLVSAYVSQDSSNPAHYVIVAINRSNSPQSVAFDGLDITGMAKRYRLTGTSTTPFLAGDSEVDLSSWIASLPAYSITTIDITASTLPPLSTYTAWMENHFTAQELEDPAISAPEADPEGCGLSNFQRYAFDLPARGWVEDPVITSFNQEGGEMHMAITFPRLSSASGLLYDIETSTDLSFWTTYLSIEPGTPSPITIPLPSAVPGDYTPHFYRLLIHDTEEE